MNRKLLLVCGEDQENFIKSNLNEIKHKHDYIYNLIYNNLIGNNWRYPVYDGNSMGFIDEISCIYIDNETLFYVILNNIRKIQKESLALEYYELLHNCTMIFNDLCEIIKNMNRLPENTDFCGTFN